MKRLLLLFTLAPLGCSTGPDSAIDPVSGSTVDKAHAVIGKADMGAVVSARV